MTRKSRFKPNCSHQAQLSLGKFLYSSNCSLISDLARSRRERLTIILSLSLSAQHSRRSYQVAAGEILKLLHVTTKTVKFSNSNYILIMKAVDGRQCFNKSSFVHSQLFLNQYSIKVLWLAVKTLTTNLGNRMNSSYLLSKFEISFIS